MAPGAVGRWRGKVVVITGAASGIGEATARLLVDTGALLVLCDIDRAGLEALATELRTAGARVTPLVVDVGDPAAIERSAKTIEDEHGRVDALLHFAGILDSHQLDDMTVDVWDRVIDINLRGSFFIVQQLVGLMPEGAGASIVLTASDSARHGSTVSGPAYASSKGGIMALTRGFAARLGPRGIRVNAVCPGLVMTGMSDGWDPAVIERATQRTPLGRLAQPEEIAEAALFLAGEAGRWVHGEVLEVNGGAYFD